MGDPQRLLMLTRNGETDDLERELLSSIQDIDPPAEAKGQAWARLSAQIGAAALVTTTHSAAAAAGPAAASTAGASAAASAGAKTGLAPLLLKALSAKVLVSIGVASVAVGAGAFWAHTQHRAALATPRQASPQTAATTSPRPAVAPAPVAPAQVPEAPVVEAAALPSPAEPVNARRVTDQRRRDQLGAESSLLTQARAELRNGDAAGAQQSLNRLQAQFPHGVLGQEREVLAIEVLAARGNRAAAKRRAQAFIAAYPKSPHSVTLARFADGP